MEFLFVWMCPLAAGAGANTRQHEAAPRLPVFLQFCCTGKFQHGYWGPVCSAISLPVTDFSCQSRALHECPCQLLLHSFLCHSLAWQLSQAHRQSSPELNWSPQKGSTASGLTEQCPVSGWKSNCFCKWRHFTRFLPCSCLTEPWNTAGVKSQ